MLLPEVRRQATHGLGMLEHIGQIGRWHEHQPNLFECEPQGHDLERQIMAAVAPFEVMQHGMGLEDDIFDAVTFGGVSTVNFSHQTSFCGETKRRLAHNSRLFAAILWSRDVTVLADCRNKHIPGYTWARIVEMDTNHFAAFTPRIHSLRSLHNRRFKFA